METRVALRTKGRRTVYYILFVTRECNDSIGDMRCVLYDIDKLVLTEGLSLISQLSKQLNV